MGISRTGTANAAGEPLTRDESHESSVSGVEMEKRGLSTGAREVRSSV